jgi:hypothetical protein
MTTKITNSNLDATIVSGLTELNETIASGDFILIYDTSAGVLKKIAATNAQLAEATLASITPTNVDSKDSATTTTFIVTGTNFYTGTTAKLKSNSGSDISFTTVTRDSLTQLTCVLSNALITAEGITDEPYDIVINSGVNEVTLANQIFVDQRPVWVTASGSLGSVTEGNAASFTVQATDPESAGAIRYDVVGGALPTDLTLNTATGAITGTAPTVVGDTTSTFTIQASDVDSNVSFREFSITVSNLNIETFTSSGIFSVPVGVSSVNVLVVARGGNSGGWEGYHPDHSYAGGINGGGGAGGLIFRPGFTVTPGASIPVTVGGAPAGSDSIFSTLTAKGGGGGGAAHPIGAYRQGYSGGSGGGGGAGEAGYAGTGDQPTRPGDSGTYGFGNPGSTGGGGAGATGMASNGGIGRAYTIADGTTPVYYAGGGAGTGATGGQGGGGPGSQTPGQANKGGGGGAGGASPGPDFGCGGSGIVIVSW